MGGTYLAGWLSTPTTPASVDAFALTLRTLSNESYTYDALGNLLTKAGVAYSYGANGDGTGAGPHQARTVGGQPYTYDANGNLVSGGGRTYAWNADNQPTSITSNGVQETYAYDADGQRLARTRGDVTAVYLAGTLWEENAVTGAWRTYYAFNGQMIAQRDGVTGGVVYFHGDHLGSVSVVTNASGAVVSRQTFSPWGEVRSGGITQTGNNFTGQWKDQTGLLFYQARYYDPVLARFVSADSIVPGVAAGSGGGAASLGYDNQVALTPLTVDFHEPGFAAGVNEENRFTLVNGFQFQLDDEAREEALYHGGPLNPQALNRYAYVLNNPVRYVDPTGHYLESAIDIASLLYDIYMIKQEGWTWINVLALGADVVGTLVPVVGGLGIIVRAGKGAKIYTQVTLKANHPVLRNILGSLFQDSDKIPGGTAGLIRHERRNGLPVTHLQKAFQEMNRLQRLLGGKYGPISDEERILARSLLQDLRDATRGLKRPPMH